MKLKKTALRNIAILLAFTICFIACEDEFTTIDSDIVNDNIATNFDTSSEIYEVISFTDVLEPIQTSGLGLYQLGVFDDPNYGRTVSSILAQVNSGLVNPTFGAVGNADPIFLDSVVLTLPLFNTAVGLNEDGGVEYELDSVISSSGSIEDIKLSMFENTYFLRSFDPNEGFDNRQPFFSNRSASANEIISISELEAVPIAVIDQLTFSNEEIVLTDNDETEPSITERLSPRIRQVWRGSNLDDADVISYWQDKILDQETQSVLSNSNNFNDYFRGIYFKTESISDNGSLALLNLLEQEANITLYYSFESSQTEGEIEQSTYTLTFGSNIVNFFDNDFTGGLLPQQDGDDVNGDENLFLKGGQGGLASIKLFNGDVADDDNTTDNAFEAWRKEFVNVDENEEFVSAKRLVNEANLVFYVNQDLLDPSTQEPNRLYLYNKINNIPLIDYAQDIQNNTLPEISIPNHLGILERDETTNDGIRYKMRITSHINNMLLNNAGNVELGLAVSGNVNLEGSISQFLVQNTSSETETLPASSVITPRGTILHGNAATGQNADKRVVLEIFFTEPN